MGRRRKVICTALAASLALSAAIASTASAETPNELTAFNTATEEHETAFLHGEQTSEKPHTLVLAGSPVVCQQTTFQAELFAGRDNEVTFTPAYSECTYEGLGTHVNMTSCDYLLHSPEFEETDLYTASTDIRCGQTDAIHITVTLLGGAACVFEIPAQESVRHVNVRNIDANHIGITPEADGIEYTAEGPFCSEEGTFEDGAYEGDTLVGAENEQGETLDLAMVGNTPEKE